MIPELIAFDLDGTSLRDDHSTFFPAFISALEKAHDRGILVIPVTGRPLSVFPELLLSHPSWETFAVLSNGAGIMDMRTRRWLERSMISPSTAEEVLSLAERLGMAVEFFIDGRLHLSRASYEIEKGMDGIDYHVGSVIPRLGTFEDDMHAVAGDGSLQIEKINLLGIGESVRDELTARLSALPLNGAWMSGRDMEITAEAATKGGAVERLTRMLGIPMERVMALGDSGNDVSLLEKAGIGVAMGNAPLWIKDRAGHVTAPYDMDGAAEAIELFALS